MHILGFNNFDVFLHVSNPRVHLQEDGCICSYCMVLFTCIGTNSMVGGVQLKCDGTRWRTGGEVKGKLANGVGSQYSSHYLGTWCIQHYCRWCAHLGCPVVDWTDAPRRFKWTRQFWRKTKSGFCAHAITFQTQSTAQGHSAVSRLHCLQFCV
jgi:hypothetical protein